MHDERRLLPRSRAGGSKPSPSAFTAVTVAACSSSRDRKARPPLLVPSRGRCPRPEPRSTTLETLEPGREPQ